MLQTTRARWLWTDLVLSHEFPVAGLPVAIAHGQSCTNLDARARQIAHGKGEGERLSECVRVRFFWNYSMTPVCNLKLLLTSMCNLHAVPGGSAEAAQLLDVGDILIEVDGRDVYCKPGLLCK